MRVRSLLACGAAALAPVSMACAADAVVMAEPEPVEYVRVCDAYGAGFFYIPGTETCLQISGELWYQIGATSDDGLGFDTPNYFEFAGDGFNKTTLAAINFDARSDTEWGTLQAFISLEAEWGDPVDGPVSAVQAWLSLGGLRMGYSESAWAEGVFEIAQAGSHSDGGLHYGDQSRHFVQYNFGGDAGLFGTISLEDDTLEGNGYMPDVVGLVGYQANWGGVWARVGYDESYGDPALPFEDDGFGVSAGVQVNVPGMDDSSLRVIGFYADGDHSFGTQSAFAGVGGGNGNAEWSVLASYQHAFTERFAASVGFQYFSDFYVPLTDLSTGLDGYIAEVSLVWTPIENFEVRAEGAYDKVETLDDSVSGFLRFSRFF